MEAGMVNIRRASPDDLTSVGSLWLQMMREHESRDPRFRLSEEPEKAYIEQLRQMLDAPDNALFVAEYERRIQGYVLALLLPNPPVFKEPRYGFIAEMVVSPTLRRSGTGRLLWGRATRWFKRKGVKSVQLNVSPLNQAGIAFWESLGFKDFLKIQWCDLDEVQPS